MTRLRIAVVGVGHLGRLHATLLSKRSDVELAAVVDASAEQAAAVAGACGADSFPTIEPLLGHVDAAIIATPTRFHAAVAAPLIEAGVHLLIEKPLTASADEAALLVGAARRRDVWLQVGHVERFNPAWTAVQSHLAEPKFIEATRTSGHKFRSTDIGVVLDLMIHDLDLVLAAVRAPLRRVEALGISLFGQHEDVAYARLEFADGCLAVLRASRASYVAERKMQLWSETGFATLDFAARTARLVRPGAAIVNRQVDAENLTGANRQRLVDHWFEDLFVAEELTAPACDQLTAEHDDFVASIRQGRAPRVDGQQAQRTLEVAEQVLDSIRHHAWDGTTDGRVGPLLTPGPHILRPPHWSAAADEPPRRREAG